MPSVGCRACFFVESRPGSGATRYVKDEQSFAPLVAARVGHLVCQEPRNLARVLETTMPGGVSALRGGAPEPMALARPKVPKEQLWPVGGALKGVSSW